MELFRLFGSVLIEDQEAIKSLKNVDNEGKKAKTSLSDIADKGVKVGASILAGAGVAVGGLLALANSTSESAAHWLELSQRTDIGIESLQRWGYAASMSGADIDKLEVGMKKLSTSMVDAQNGSEKSKTAYEALGISMSDLSTMSPEQTFDAVMAKLADMPESAEKNVIGNQLLGKSYTELKPLLAEGSEGIQALKDNADALGIVMGADAVVAAEGFGDQMDNVKLGFEGVKNKLAIELMPKLVELLDWILSKMPQIQEVAGKALDFISGTIGFVTDNSNILIPILGGLLGAFIALKAISVVNGLMTAWKASTIATTLATGGLNAVMAANPIAIVILAITALIAIGIALAMNWDKVKEGAGKLWDKIKSVFTGIKNTIDEKVDGIKTKVSDVFGKIKDVMSKPFEDAKTVISGVIEKIKGFLNFKWEFPKLKMPHFKVTGSMNPLKWIDEGTPKLSVDWYAKGGIFSKPTIFNSPYGLKGVGDAKSPEVVAPLHELNGMIESGISRAIAPLFMNQSHGEAPILEATFYFGDDRIWKSAKRGKLKEDRRYELQEVF